MYTKTLEYRNANGDLVKTTKYFNLTKRELTLLNSRYGGDITTYIKNVKSPKRIIELFEDFILSAYGVKSEDGESFIKNKQIKEEFECSFYYAKLFDLFTNDIKKFEAFIQGVIGLTQEELEKFKLEVEKLEQAQGEGEE